MRVIAEMNVPICVFTRKQCPCYNAPGEIWDFDEGACEEGLYCSVPSEEKVVDGVPTLIIHSGCQNVKWIKKTVAKNIRSFEQVDELIFLSDEIHWAAEFDYLKVSEGGYERVIFDNREATE